MIQNRGFTLVELLLSVTVIGLLVGLSAPVYVSFSARNNLDIGAQSIAEAIRRAQTYARGVRGDSQWGLQIQADTATLYKGATYASRDTTYDEDITIDGITTSGLANIQFTKLTGLPSTSGNITLTSSTNETRIITVNGEGMVNY